MLRYLTRFCLSIFLLLSVAIAAIAYEIPQPVGFVNDFASVLKPQTRKKLEILLRELEQKTSVEFSVVTIKKLPPDSDIFDYSVEMFQKWGIGKKGKDNGVLFLVDIGDRKLRIDTGYGMEGILPDGLLGRIRDNYILPYFKKGEYDKGIFNGTMAIAKIIADAYHVKLTGYLKPKKVKSGGLDSIDIFLLIAVLFFLAPTILPFILVGGRGSYRSDWDNTFGGGFGGGMGGGFGGFGGGSTGGGGVGGSW